MPVSVQVLLPDLATEIALGATMAGPSQITPVTRLSADVPPRPTVCETLLFCLLTSPSVMSAVVGFKSVVCTLPAPRPSWVNVILPTPLVTFVPLVTLMVIPPKPLAPFCVVSVCSMPTPGVARSDTRLIVPPVLPVTGCTGSPPSVAMTSVLFWPAAVARRIRLVLPSAIGLPITKVPPVSEVTSE